MPNEVDNFLNSVNGTEGVTDEQRNHPFHQNDDQQADDQQGQQADDQSGDGSDQDQQDQGGDDQDDASKVPFHKDPKIQRFIQKEIAKATRGMTRQETSDAQAAAQGSQTSDELIDAFTQIIGNDTPEKVHALKMLERGLTNIREEARAGQRQYENDRQAEAAAEQELNDGLDLIEDNFDIDLTSTDPKARKMRADFLDFVERIAPKDAKGEIRDYPDFVEAFQLFKERQPKPKPNTRAKDLAARGMSRSSDASQAQQPQGDSWRDVDRWFSKLGK